MRWGVPLNGWSRSYAWRPTRLVTGEIAWLEWVEITDYFNSAVPAGIPCNWRMFSRTFVARPIEDVQP